MPEMTMEVRIRSLLEAALEPQLLKIADDSHKHAGHAGARDGGQTHYRITIASETLTGKNRVAQHREVNRILQPCFDAGLHALQINVVAI